MKRWHQNFEVPLKSFGEGILNFIENVGFQLPFAVEISFCGVSCSWPAALLLLKKILIKQIETFHQGKCCHLTMRLLLRERNWLTSRAYYSYQWVKLRSLAYVANLGTPGQAYSPKLSSWLNPTAYMLRSHTSGKIPNLLLSISRFIKVTDPMRLKF